VKSGFFRTWITNGTVVSTPTARSAQPAPFLVSRLSLSERSKPKPVPSATRVPPINVISGSVKVFVFIVTILELTGVWEVRMSIAGVNGPAAISGAEETLSRDRRIEKRLARSTEPDDSIAKTKRGRTTKLRLVVASTTSNFDRQRSKS
jgi:hypothetical protein